MVAKSILTPGQIVRQARTAKGLSREQLAVHAGVSSATIGRLELSDALPKHAKLVRIAEVVGVPSSDLYAAAEQAAS